MSNGIEKKLDQFLSFPVLTRELGTGAPSPGGAAAPAGGSPVGQIVEAALRDVLGWRPRVADAKGFLAALNQSFMCQKVNGRSECKWTPHSYAVSVQANLGTITGAQASLLTRAQNVADQVTPLLDGLHPMIPDADDEDIQSTLSIIRSTLTELVNELGQPGGPRVPRVDDLFAQLLGHPPRDPNAEKVSGQLGILRQRLSLTRGAINTVEDEQNYTNFLLIVDYIQGLEQSWLGQRSEFGHNPATAFLGTQLVLVSRQLAVIAESVQEYYSVLDSLFLGPAERETLLLNLGDPADPTVLSVAELFGWVDRFVSEEGPHLLQDGGIDGVKAFQSTLANLIELVEDATALAQQPSSNPTPAFHDRRGVTISEEVLLGLETVAVQLAAVEDAIVLASGEKLTVSSLKHATGHANPPSPGQKPTILNADVRGSGFDADTWVSLGRGVVVNSVDLLSSERLAIEFWVRADASGVKDLTVINGRGQVATLLDAFVVSRSTAPQKIIGLSPSRAAAGTKVAITLESQDNKYKFAADSAVRLRRKAQPEEKISETLPGDRSKDSSSLTAVFDLTQAPEGRWDVVVSDSARRDTHELAAGFTVLPAGELAKPRITSARRNGIGSDGNLEVVITGSGFTSSTAVSFGDGIQILATNDDEAPRRIRATLRALPGSRGSKPVVVINPDGQSAVRRDALSIAPADEQEGKNVK